MGAKQYDTLSNEAIVSLAQQAISPYSSCRDATIKLLCRSENATLLVTAGSKKYALRIHREQYHSQQAIVSELLWLDALHHAGIGVPEALYDDHGERIQTLLLPEGGCRYAVLFHWIDGEMPTTEVDPASFRQLGRITAQLHQHSQRWQKPDSFQRLSWDHHSMVSANSHWGDWRDAPGLDKQHHAVVEEAITHIQGKMQAFGDSPHRFGLIHADLRLTNVLLHEGETRVIDFDDCGMGWYLHDLAAAISFVEHHPQATQWIDHWLAGYEQVAHLGDEDIAVLPAMLMQRRIQLTAWVASHQETEMAHSLGPDWSSHTVRLCQRYLEGEKLPVGL